MSEFSEDDSRVEIHLHLDAPLTINVVHTVRADDALTELIQSIKQDIATMATDVNAAIAELQADVTQETTVNQSAITLIQGFAAQLAAAVAAAAAAGATPAQLQALSDLGTSINANATALAAAVAAGTTPPATA
jgi:hypothetical protein